MAWLTGNDVKNDWLIGTAGADTIKGLGGDDTLKGGGGADHLDGGAGVDTASYIDSTQPVVVDLTTGRGYGGAAQGDTLVSIENVMGSGYGDGLYGNSIANTLYGMDGIDTLEGRGGNDVLEGGYGDDSLNGGAGADILNGGEGRDTVSYAQSPAGVFVALSSQFASGGDADGDTLLSIESARGSRFNDQLWGDNNANILVGDEGNDDLKGFGGYDQLYGGIGEDTLYGMDGNDYLFGQAGNDRIDGGAGIDLMYGDMGSDRFVWSSAGDTGVTLATADVIMDFNAAEGDRIDLRDIDADVYAAGNQAFRFIGTAAFTLNAATPDPGDVVPGEIRYYHADGNTYIELQTGTSPDVEGVICLQGILTPQASWFWL